MGVVGFIGSIGFRSGHDYVTLAATPGLLCVFLGRGVDRGLGSLLSPLKPTQGTFLFPRLVFSLDSF